MSFKSRFLCSVTVAGVVAASAAAAQAADTVTFASWGGSYQEAQAEALLAPAAKALGIEFKEASHKGLAELRSQVLSGAVQWDIVDLGATDCAQGSVEGLFEPLDYSVIDASDVAPEMAQEHWVALIYYSTVLAYNSEKYKDNPPQSWADFWDVEKFPGTRALRGSPIGTMEIALLADGVEPENLKPYDVDRAFASLEKIKPHVDVWWTSGAQSAQLIRDGEVDMLGIWSNRLTSAIKDGAKAGFTFNQGLANADCLVVPKGAPNKELAMKAINEFLKPDNQAAITKLIDIGPVNPKAVALGGFSEEKLSLMPSTDENMKTQAFQDFAWWGENGAEIKEQWDNFITQ